MKMFMLLAIFLVLFYSENCWVSFVSKCVRISIPIKLSFRTGHNSRLINRY